MFLFFAFAKKIYMLVPYLLTKQRLVFPMPTPNLSWRRYLLPPLHPEGWRVLAVIAAISALFGVLFKPLGWLGAFITIWSFYFFRDPERVTPEGDDKVISPADGIVQAITEAAPPPELEMGEKKRTRISIFMSVFNVHVNRIPITGKIVKKAYHPGVFVNATLDKASEDNERMALRVAPKGSGRGKNSDLAVVQIAGLVARRIVTKVKEEQEMTAGERFGIIRFGSRLDVYLPEGVEPQVLEGQTMIAGETILANLTKKQD